MRTFPNELWINIFGHLPVTGLLSAYRVNQHWRSLVPYINDSLRRAIFNLVVRDIKEPSDSDVLHCVSLPDRISYVAEVEDSHGILIPEPYRTILTEWPIKRPPPGSHWPHAVRFHASGFCSCDRVMYDRGMCRCKENQVTNQNITLKHSLLEMIRRHESFDYHEPHHDCRWELFSNAPRLITDSQNEQTIRFILKHPPAKWRSPPGVPDERRWPELGLRVLRLSRYTFAHDNSAVTGEFYMIVEGPARGEIHGWESGGWYNGFEANSFLDWRYNEWERDNDGDSFKDNVGNTKGDGKTDGKMEAEET